MGGAARQRKGEILKKAASEHPIRVLRKKLGLNQADFWAHVGVTQSGGSRYESGRIIAPPIRLLIKLIYGSGGGVLLRKLREKARP